MCTNFEWSDHDFVYSNCSLRLSSTHRKTMIIFLFFPRCCVDLTGFVWRWSSYAQSRFRVRVLALREVYLLTMCLSNHPTLSSWTSNLELLVNYYAPPLRIYYTRSSALLFPTILNCISLARSDALLFFSLLHRLMEKCYNIVYYIAALHWDAYFEWDQTFFYISY